MFVEFLQPFGAWAVGACTNIGNADVARSLIAAGQAKEIDADSFLQTSQASELAKFRSEMMSTIKEVLGQSRSATTGPPGGKELVDTLNLDSAKVGEPVFEEKKGQGFSDVLRCIHAVGSRGCPAEIVDYASKRLRHLYTEERVDYKLNHQTGKMDSIVTRHLDGGGTETITRTGTDSMGGGATYGFTVKPTYLGDMFRIAREREAFASACRHIPVGSGVEVKYPSLGQYSAPTLLNGIPQAAVFSGISLSYKGETAARVESDGTAEEIEFKIVDLTGATSFSRDYIVDNFISMDSVITGLFGDAMAWVEDWVTIRGNSVGTIQGYFNSAALIQGGGGSGGTGRANANKIASDDLGWMLSHLAGQCERGARWIAHRSTIPQLFILNNAAGTPVFQPNASIVQSDPLSIMAQGSGNDSTYQSAGTLLGMPIFFTEKVPQLGTPGDITLVCPSQYGLAERAGLEIGMSDQFYFSTDKIAYRFKKRHDGRSLWRAPYQDASAINTGGAAWQVSPFIMLK